MDASIKEGYELFTRLLSEGKLGECELVAKTFKMFPEKEIDRVINPIHDDVKKACLKRMEAAVDLKTLHNLAKIAKLSKDEVRPYVVQWINEGYVVSDSDASMLKELV